MALQETVTPAKHGHGAVIATWSGGPTFRVTKFELEDPGGEYIELIGGNVDQIVAFIETSKGKGRVRLTTDEVLDIDASTVRGAQTTFTLGQELPLGTAKKWHMAAGFVLIVPQSVGGGRPPAQTETVLLVRPYHATIGTAMWTFDNDTSNA